jgi:hypothetical protein
MDLDTETTEAESTLLEQAGPRKLDRPSPIMILITSTTNLIQLQSNLKDRVKKEYEFRNA